MATGRHIAKRRTRAVVIVAAAAGVFVLALGGAAYSAYHYEQERSDTILPGVTVAGIDVGGLTRSEAVQAVREGAAGELEAPIKVTAGGSTWTVTPADLGRRAQAVAAVNQALAVNDSMSTFSRFWHRFRQEPVDVEIDLGFNGDGRVDGFIGEIAKKVRSAPTNASIAYDDGDIAFVKSHPGRALNAAKAAEQLRSAIAADSVHKVALPMKKLAPKVTVEDLGPTIVVRLDQNKLYLYEGFQVERTYSVATAKPGYTTPNGDWIVDRKAVDPTWYNPALDSWGADLPAVIPGGPGNPMGTRALYITAPGLIRIHGTSDDSSIGRYASHGCIRMHNSEIEQLYPLVPVGTHVLIVGSRPAGAQEWDTPATADI
jgi:lipoprotein-anchoring transpeptidase ErfK/SrfK